MHSKNVETLAHVAAARAGETLLNGETRAAAARSRVNAAREYPPPLSRGNNANPAARAFDAPVAAFLKGVLPQAVARRFPSPEKLRELAAYIFWGCATTFVNFVAYALATRILGMNVVPASALAWIVAVLFAFFTNKLWVFGSKSLAFVLVLRELAAFVVARLASGAIEIFMMWFFVDCLGGNDWFWKIASGIVVIVANYIFSLCFVFKKQ